MPNQATQAAENLAGAAGRPSDPVDAMLRGRYRQGNFGRWVWKRIRDLYPK